MKNTGSKRSPWKTLLITMLAIVGVTVVAFGAFSAVFYFEDLQMTCWKSGEVIIDGQSITLPCPVEDFESALDIRLPEADPIVKISRVTVEGEGGPISFNVHLSEDFTKVTGIVVRASSIGDRSGIVFPGGVSLESDIETVIELYSTKPLNIYHSYWSEEIGKEKNVSAGYRYVDKKSFEIEVCTFAGELDDIAYFYIAGE